MLLPQGERAYTTMRRMPVNNVKPFTLNKEEEEEGEEEEGEDDDDDEEDEEKRRERRRRRRSRRARKREITEKGEVCECVRMRLGVNDAGKREVCMTECVSRRKRIQGEREGGYRVGGFTDRDTTGYGKRGRYEKL